MKQRGELLVNKDGIETGKKFTWENTAKQLISIL
jgi:hypothetical protein